jgi:hypothetical protein
MPMFLPIREPTLRAWSFDAVTWTWMSGLAELTRFAEVPAASRMVPLGATMTPSLVTLGATRKTWPPVAAVMLPWLVMVPVFVDAVKLLRPAAKSEFARLRVEATRPPTSTTEPCPKTMPLGLMR